jgi:hypothetical protein
MPVGVRGIITNFIAGVNSAFYYNVEDGYSVFLFGYEESRYTVLGHSGHDTDNSGKYPVLVGRHFADYCCSFFFGKVQS